MSRTTHSKLWATGRVDPEASAAPKCQEHRAPDLLNCGDKTLHNGQLVRPQEGLTY
jgi:hypothetical protein